MHNTLMFDLGLTEILILLLIVIVLFFPHKTRDIVRNIGIAIGAVKEGKKEVEAQLKKGE